MRRQRHLPDRLVPLAQGVLTGKYKPGQPVPEGSRFASADMAVSQDLVYSDAILEAVQRLVPIAEEAGMSMATLALAWVLRRGEVASAITGASRPDQVHANAAASGVELSDDLLNAVDQALGEVPVTEPTLAPGAEAASSTAELIRLSVPAGPTGTLPALTLAAGPLGRAGQGRTG